MCVNSAGLAGSLLDNLAAIVMRRECGMVLVSVVCGTVRY